MKPNVPFWLPVLAGLLAITAALQAAAVAGGFVYAKHYTTSLLSEPRPMSQAAAKVGLGHKLRVDEVRGLWLHVSDGPTTGWVFHGNVSETKPVEIKGLDGLPIAASATTATAAARPLAPAAVDYAGRRHLTNSTADLEWLLRTCHDITDEDVDHFLQEKKKGEFQ